MLVEDFAQNTEQRCGISGEDRRRRVRRQRRTTNVATRRRVDLDHPAATGRRGVAGGVGARSGQPGGEDGAHVEVAEVIAHGFECGRADIQ